MRVRNHGTHGGMSSTTEGTAFPLNCLWPPFGAVSSVVAFAVVLTVFESACYKPPPEALILSGNMLTVSNHTKTDWSKVEVWLNTYYHVTFDAIPAGGRMQAPLDFFVAGLGQRFSFARMQVRDLRLTAKLPDGTPLELKKAFEVDGLEGVARGMGKKR